MSTFGDEYILQSGRSGHDRLRVIGEIHDCQTRELLGRARLGAGARYVEFGCGLGYVTRWAASQGAQATGIDLSQDQVAEAGRLALEAGLENVEFRVASIYEHGFAPESFDYSYSRWLLVHLSRPVEAMRKIYEALKPGGVMVCEEADLTAIYTEPRASAYEEFRDLAVAGGDQRGVDYSGGRRVHSWAREAGFEVLYTNAYQPQYREGAHKGFWSWTFVEAGASLVQAGVLSEERLRELAGGMRAADEDPDVIVAHSRMHQLIARKPLGGVRK